MNPDEHGGRLPRPRPEELSQEQREVYDMIVGGPRAGARRVSPLTDEAGRLEGPFNAMLFSPPLGTALQAVGAAVRYATELSDRERELAILRVAAHAESSFEWLAHEQIGRAAGLTDADLDTVLGGPASDTLSASETTVLDLVSALLVHRDADDRQWAHAVAALGLVKAVELVTLVGYYQTLELGLRVFRVPLPAGQHGRWGQP